MGAVTAGAALSTRCALVPLKPKLLTPTALGATGSSRVGTRMSTAAQLDMRVQPLEMQRGRHRAVLEHQDRLEQPGHPGRGLGMAEIALDRAHPQRPRPGRRTPRPAHAARSGRPRPCRCRAPRPRRPRPAPARHRPAPPASPPPAPAPRAPSARPMRPSWLTALPATTARTRSPPLRIPQPPAAPPRRSPRRAHSRPHRRRTVLQRPSAPACAPWRS